MRPTTVNLATFYHRKWYRRENFPTNKKNWRHVARYSVQSMLFDNIHSNINEKQNDKNEEIKNLNKKQTEHLRQ